MPLELVRSHLPVAYHALDDQMTTITHLSLLYNKYEMVFTTENEV